MTRKDQVDSVFSQIATIMTLSDKFTNGSDFWENLSDNLGKNGKTYPSAISFLVDVLFAFGITKEFIIDRIVEFIFDIPNATSLYDGIDKIDIEMPEWIEKIEDGVKVVLADILTTILSCSVNPIIPEGLKSDEDGGGIIVSRSYIDPNGMLSINPSSSRGRCYYNVKDYSGSSEYLERNNLFMSFDLNAFIWYCNKVSWSNNERAITWDTRRSSKMQQPGYRTSLSDWTKFINNEGVDYNNSLQPIMKVEKYSDDYMYSNNGYSLMKVVIDKHYKTIYQFNNDYLRNIQIFEPKMMLVSLLDSLRNRSATLVADTIMSLDLVRKYIIALVDKAVLAAVESDDYTVSDCFYEFDNDLWADMLAKTESMKYNGTVNDEADKPLTDAINDAYSRKSSDSTFNEVKTIVYDAIGTNTVVMSENEDIVLNSNIDWLRELLLLLIMPFVNAVLSPKVLLLFVINLQAMGLVNGFNDNSMNKVMSFIFGKIFSLIFGVIRLLKDMIVQLLIWILKKWVTPFMIKVRAYLLLEKTRAWLTILMEALTCLPNFGMRLGMIDDVTYADIIPTQAIPESDTGKCDV